ncbi:MAG: family 16 glycosylhydrolase, partial [Thermoflexales bacterium]|nr:family 16 glycosylhydrolase [Thermoflexales bacterium]
ILSDNKSGPGDTAERYHTTFTDNAVGWRHVSLPWNAFYRGGWQPDGAPDDGLSLTEMWAYAIAFPDGASGTIYIDDVALMGAGQVELKAGFDSQQYTVNEGEPATLAVQLNMTATYPVTVSYAVTSGTALAGQDLTATTGLLVFPAGTLSRTIVVQTIDDDEIEDDETFVVNLSNPVSVTLGARSQATVVIRANDRPVQPCGGKALMVDDFEDGQLPRGQDANGLDIGYVVFGNFPAATVAITTAQVAVDDSLAIPGQLKPNTLLKADYNVVGWGGFTHAFANDALDTWVSQDWSMYEGLSFWFYGSNSGAQIQVEIFDNRSPGSTADDAERWYYRFADNFIGWRFLGIPFADFARRTDWQPAGAPADGVLNLTAVWGYAFSFPADVGARTNYVDDVKVGPIVRQTIVDDFESGLPYGRDADNMELGFFTWGDPGSTVTFTTASVTPTGPLALPCQAAPNTVFQLDSTVASWGGLTHHLENAAVDAWAPQDWSTYEGIAFWLYGTNSGVSLFFEVQDNRNPNSTKDDTEIWTFPFPDDFSGWRYVEIPFNKFTRKEIGNGAPNDGFGRTEVHGWAFGTLATGGAQRRYLDDVTLYGYKVVDVPLAVSFAAIEHTVGEGGTAAITVTLNKAPTQTVTVDYATKDSRATPGRDYTPVAGRLTFDAGVTEQTFSVTTLEDSKAEGDERIALLLSNPVGAVLGARLRAALTIRDNDTPDPAMLFDVEQAGAMAADGLVTLNLDELRAGTPMALPGQGAYENVLKASYTGPGQFGRTFGAPQDWSGYQGLSFWYYGSRSGNTVTLEVADNKTSTTAAVAPQDWQIVWSDEFDDPAGTPPNPANWTHEIGDGFLNEAAFNGWGNGEFEYYTTSTDNAATDGQGSLVITAKPTNPATNDLACWYGMCDYTSARLISAGKAEFAYGRVEARLKLPFGQGLWPAFWMLGNDIGQVGWPQSGEIDVMENIGREPTIAHGTIHGPGYSGGNGIGGGYTLPAGTVSSDFHTYAVDWTPTHITWTVDGNTYFVVTSTHPRISDWVFDHPFYIIMNVAVGGTWPGSPDASTTFPQTMMVDYVRVSQAVDTAEVFEASFTDDFEGWQQVFIPFSQFARSANQAAGAPDDGLGLDEVWGLHFKVGSSGTFWMDQVKLSNAAPSLTLVKDVTPTLDVAPGGLVTYTITISNGGDSPAIGVVMSDTLPAQLTFDAWVQQGSALLPGPSGNTIAWGPWPVPAGQSYTLRFTAVVTDDAGYYRTAVTNTARFASTNAGSGADDAVFSIGEPPARRYDIFLPLVMKNF